MLVEMSKHTIDQPKHDIGNVVLFFNHVDGWFDYGEVVQLQVIKTNTYQTIAYAIKVGDNTIPCVPDKLVFDDKDDANEWIDRIKTELNQ